MGEQENKQPDLQRKLYLSFLLLSVFLLVTSLGITLSLDIRRKQQDIDQRLQWAAAYIAVLPQVRAMLANGYPSAEGREVLETFSESLQDADVMMVCDVNNYRYFHTNRLTTGDTLINEDEKRILQGEEPYLTTGYGTYGTQRRAFHAIQKEDGTIDGYVMVSAFTARISSQQKSIMVIYGTLFVVLLVVSAGVARVFYRIVRRDLLGYDPEELVQRYLHQDTMLNSLNEGLIVADRSGKIQLWNRLAAEYFSPQKLKTGMKLSSIYPDSQLKQVTGSGVAAEPKTVDWNGRQLFLHEVPLRTGKKQATGVMLVCQDKTELMAMSDELSGAKNMMDTMRAFNHEFLNKLHVILGYLESGETQKAITFITNSQMVSSQSIRETANAIRASKICALVIGKMMHGAEMGIQVSITQDSECREKDLLLSEEDYVTIIGNLLENAIEELHSGNCEVKEVILGLHFTSECSIITCMDTGRGIGIQDREHIFEKGISSKGQGRGTGLYLIRKIVSDHGGTIELESEPGEGTIFTITISRQGEDNV